MKLSRVLVLAAIAVALPMAALAQQQVVFGNNDGTFTYNEITTTMSLGSVHVDGGSSMLGSAGVLTELGGLSNFGIPDASATYNPNTGTCTPACLGNITFTTGAAIAGTNTITATGGGAHFGMGGDFTVSYTNGVTFSGSFSHAKWINVGAGNWAFTGYIMNETLTIPMSGGGSETFSNINAGTIQLTDTGNLGSNHPNKSAITFKDSAGSTNFSVAPEPGTLTLFGSGLVALGTFARRRLTARSTASQD